MIVQALKQFPMPALTCAALVMFLAVFVGVVIKTFVLTKKSEAEEFSRVVFENSEADRRKV